MPMSWGFPTLVQNSSLVNFENFVQGENDFEFTDISFPTASSSTYGFSTFPTIKQMSQKIAFANSVSYSNQQQSMTFSYPWISIGYSPVPSMGFL